MRRLAATVFYSTWLTVGATSSCDLAQISEQALNLLQDLRSKAVSTDDVAPNTTAQALSRHPIVLYSQYLSIAGREEPLPAFVHYSGEDIEESVRQYCKGPEWDSSSVDACLSTLHSRVLEDEALRARHNLSVEQTLEICRIWRLPPHTDLAEVAARAADLEECSTPAARSEWRRALHRALVSTALPPLRESVFSGRTFEELPTRRHRPSTRPGLWQNLLASLKAGPLRGRVKRTIHNSKSSLLGEGIEKLAYRLVAAKKSASVTAMPSSWSDRNGSRWARMASLARPRDPSASPATVAPDTASVAPASGSSGVSSAKVVAGWS